MRPFFLKTLVKHIFATQNFEKHVGAKLLLKKTGKAAIERWCCNFTGCQQNINLSRFRHVLIPYFASFQKSYQRKRVHTKAKRFFLFPWCLPIINVSLIKKNLFASNLLASSSHNGWAAEAKMWKQEMNSTSAAAAEKPRNWFPSLTVVIVFLPPPCFVLPRSWVFCGWPMWWWWCGVWWPLWLCFFFVFNTKSW